jgi:hypothetical protein
LEEHGVSGAVVRQSGDEPRNIDDLLVHPAPLVLPPGRPAERLEQGVMALEPARQVIDPGASGERQATKTSEARIQPRLAETEQAALLELLHAL